MSFQKNSESATIIFSDNGIGLTEEEVHRFLATIANSSKGAKTFQPEENDYIGRFGIGLLSCFIVSSEIVMITTSAKNGKTTEWLGNADGTYQVKELESAGREPGTIVYLRALPEILEEESCFEKKGAYRNA
ncbi:heat shock protein 90 [Listeria fleischmannii FSL S10-1203]|uniref:Heat shock protein 90 n=1 Tax=Listeria fleischmannii FSL S10-1203 TaxID=1265822 RepID=W7D5M9_9LIST|nr:heat shock protein 90 [Listeria fleischmannii FSL S10-1203]